MAMHRVGRGWSLVLLLLGAAPIRADETPLLWGADAEGGVPYIFQDAKTGELIGFEVDLARALGKQLGRKIEHKQYAFKELTEGLNRGDFDLAMNGLEMTPERVRLVRFCRPYYIYKLQMVVRADDNRFTTLAEAKKLQAEDKLGAIATMEATAAERLLKRQGVRYKSYDDQEGPFKDLGLGVAREVDGVLIDLPIALYYAHADATMPHAKKLKGFKLVGEPIEKGYYGIAVKKDRAELAEQVNRALEKLLASGELQKIYERWGLWNDDQDGLPLARVEDVALGEATEWTFERYFPLLLEGAIVTIVISFASMALAIFLGLWIAVARMYGPGWLQLLAVGYIEFFRGIPTLLLLYFLYFGLPGIAQYYEVPLSLTLSPWTAAILGLGLNYSAYEAEIYRAGIGAIPAGQWEAAASLGMPTGLAFRRIILPQALRTIIPPMTNDFVALFKETSLVSVIAVVELSKQYQILTKSGGDFLTIGVATAFLYLIMSVPLGWLSRHLEHKWGKHP